LFGHGGANSLLSYLKGQGLLMTLAAKEDHQMGVFSILQLELTLTKKGLENSDEVLAAVFAFAKILRDAGPQENVFEEC
jgi:protease-3